MPVHDWTLVSAGTFHHFHTTWTTHLCDALNEGGLPGGYYALVEQHAGQIITDILTLHPDEAAPSAPTPGTVALAEAPPKISRRLRPSEQASLRASRRTIAVRHASNHRVAALIEFLSPSNKDRPSSVQDFVEKTRAALRHGCHVLVVDLFPPGPHDPQGIHAAIWEAFGEPEDPPSGKPLAVVSYMAGIVVEAFLEPLGVGDQLPEAPLFLEAGRYVPIPLEASYQQAFRGVPALFRAALGEPLG